jgi:hypothetical protein
MTTERKQTRPRIKAARAPKPRVEEPSIWVKIIERGKRIPPEELARHPKDGAANLDHYLYGVPKQDPE